MLNSSATSQKGRGDDAKTVGDEALDENDLGCGAFLVLVVIAALLSKTAVLLFIIPCMLMMGAMVWMMMGGRNGGQGS